MLGDEQMKAVIFDMYETLITEYRDIKYFSYMMAEDLGVNKDLFAKIWTSSEKDRSIGKITFEEIIRTIMKACNCNNEEGYNLVVKKRYETKRSCFKHLHKDLIPMLNELKKRNIKIGLISNCFSEEVKVISESLLYPYFDVPVLSYESKLYKPDPEIYKECLKKLKLSPDKCIYVGDGGHNELQGAKSLGMTALQAGWYLKEFRKDNYKIKGFPCLENPMDIINYL